MKKNTVEILSEQTFEELKQYGHIVPRDEKRYIQEYFKVGKEYTVRKRSSKETLKVRCTQDCPTHLKVIES